MVVTPTLAFERELWARADVVIGIDEVGRGAIAGPVTVGALALGPECGAMPEHLRDSKAMTALRRSATAPLVRSWGVASTGHASAAEIDRFGITVALGLAGRRALVALHGAGVPVHESTLLLDGTHDWLRPALRRPLPTVLRAKADRDCGSVAGAACVAKVERDELMVAAHESHPAYGWASNKGYGAAAHFAAIAEHGASDLHRRTWLHAERHAQDEDAAA